MSDKQITNDNQGGAEIGKLLVSYLQSNMKKPRKKRSVNSEKQLLALKKGREANLMRRKEVAKMPEKEVKEEVNEEELREEEVEEEQEQEEAAETEDTTLTNIIELQNEKINSLLEFQNYYYDKKQKKKDNKKMIKKNTLKNLEETMMNDYIFGNYGG